MMLEQGFRSFACVKGEVNPWRGAEQKRSTHPYVYPGPPGFSCLVSHLPVMSLRCTVHYSTGR